MPRPVLASATFLTIFSILVRKSDTLDPVIPAAYSIWRSLFMFIPMRPENLASESMLASVDLTTETIPATAAAPMTIPKRRTCFPTFKIDFPKPPRDLPAPEMPFLKFAELSVSRALSFPICILAIDGPRIFYLVARPQVFYLKAFFL